MCNEAVTHNPYVLRFISVHLKTQEMCDEAVHITPTAFFLIPDHFKTLGMCDAAVRIEPCFLVGVPDHFKTQKMCDDAVRKGLFSLRDIPDWLLTWEQIQLWHDDDEHCDDDKPVEWYDGYKKWKAQKTSIKEELLPIAWHPSRYWDWCVHNDEKQETEKLSA